MIYEMVRNLFFIFAPLGLALHSSAFLWRQAGFAFTNSRGIIPDEQRHRWSPVIIHLR